MYVIADREHLRTTLGSCSAYRWQPDEYIRIPTRDSTAAFGSKRSAYGSASMALRIVCYDREGKEIGDYTAIANQLDAIRQASEAATQYAEAAKQRAEAEKQARELAEAKTSELEAELARLRGQ